MSSPPESTRSKDAFEPAEKAAADWFVRRDRGLTAAQQAEFKRWLRADERHAQIFGEMEDAWQLLGEAETPAAPAGRRRKWVWIPLALAASVAAALLLSSHRWPLAVPEFAESASTEVGALRRIDLPDGSVAQLSGASEIDVHFRAKERRVVLRRGEAHFQVAKNPAWPFYVEAKSVEVRAVGTAFDVRLGTDAVDLLVTEGKVRVRDPLSGEPLLLGGDPREEPLLVARQRLHISLTKTGESVPAKAVVLTPKEIADMMAWEQRRLVFRAERLADIVAQFNRFNRHRLTIGTPELAERRFGGAFLASDYPDFVRSLEAHYQVAADQKAEETVLRIRPTEVAPPMAEAAAGTAPDANVVFASQHLADIVAQFNRHNAHRLIIADPKLGALRFGGVFPLGDYDGFVRTLEENFHVVAERGASETVLRLAP